MRIEETIYYTVPRRSYASGIVGPCNSPDSSTKINPEFERLPPYPSIMIRSHFRYS